MTKQKPIKFTAQSGLVIEIRQPTLNDLELIEELNAKCVAEKIGEVSQVLRTAEILDCNPNARTLPATELRFIAETISSFFPAAKTPEDNTLST